LVLAVSVVMGKTLVAESYFFVLRNLPQVAA